MNSMIEKVFNSYAEAKKFAKTVWATDRDVSLVRLMKERDGDLWVVLYIKMDKKFMENYYIEEEWRR